MIRLRITIFTAVLLIFACCTQQPKDEDQAKECAQSFAESFFTFNYEKALSLCDDSSRNSVMFYLSNITDKDIDSIRAIPYPPTILVEHVERGSTDSIAQAVCRLKDIYLMDSLGRNGRIVADTCFVLHLVREAGSWKIRMVDRLRNEK